jgi:hypothetical protein
LLKKKNTVKNCDVKKKENVYILMDEFPHLSSMSHPFYLSKFIVPIKWGKHDAVERELLSQFNESAGDSRGLHSIFLMILWKQVSQLSFKCLELPGDMESVKVTDFILYSQRTPLPWRMLGFYTAM